MVSGVHMMLHKIRFCNYLLTSTCNISETIRFEEYGPVILNADGSMRRIDNWDQVRC